MTYLWGKGLERYLVKGLKSVKAVS